MPTICSAGFVALSAGLMTATVIDLRTRRIPNLLTALMAATGLGLAAAGVSGMSLAAAAVGSLVGLALMLPGHVLGATGAGDVKLMAAVGALLGPAHVVRAFLFTAVAGGVLAIVIAIRRRRLAATLRGTARIVAAPKQSRRGIESAGSGRRFAYGPAIAAGSLLAAILG